MPKKRWNIVLATMFKDEAPYLDEWLSYYIALGVDHFFLYDNGSTDNSAAVLKKYVNRGLATLISWPMAGGQLEAFQHAALLIGPHANWLTFLDTDEFLVLKKHDTIPELLGSLPEDTEQVIVAWKNFLYSGHLAKPSGRTIDNFFWAARDKAVQVKHLVKCDSLVRANVHFSATQSGNAVLDNGAVGRPSTVAENPAYTLAQINHYTTRSYQEAEARSAKGRASGHPGKAVAPFPKELPKEGEHWQYDNAILRHAERSREVMRMFQSLADQPHRYGFYKQNLALAYRGNHRALVHYYLAKSVGNYLLREARTSHGTAFKVMVREQDGSMKQVNGLLPDWPTDVLAFEAPGLSEAGPFLGSIHRSDFMRMFSASLLQHWRGGEVGDNLSVTLPRYHALSVVALIDGFEGGALEIAVGDDAPVEINAPAGSCAFSFYKYGFFAETKPISIKTKGEHKQRDVFAFALP